MDLLTYLFWGASQLLPGLGIRKHQHQQPSPLRFHMQHAPPQPAARTPESNNVHIPSLPAKTPQAQRGPWG
jgi:hypothetical protein